MKARPITPPMSEARVAAQWRAIHARLPSRPRAGVRIWVAVGGFATLALFLAIAAAWRRPGPMHSAAVVSTGTVLESGAAESAATLVEGSRVVLDPESRITLAEASSASVRIEVERGGITVDATHRDERKFVVVAAGHEVRVVGTQFSVRLRGLQVDVGVERGEVRVLAPDGSQRAVQVGETWSSAPPDGPREVAAVPELQAAPVHTPPSAPSGAARPSAAPESAMSLLDSAQRARAEGRIADAAQLYDRLRRTWRTDPRAALAALELGRLRLDRLGDPRGAEEALRDALALGSSSPLRQEVEATRIEALSRIGDVQSGRAARDAYLARYPDGVDSKAIGVYCGDR